MILKVNPVQRLRGTVHLPASKSYSIRAFLIAACGGNSRILAPSDCDDAKVALTAAQHLGMKISRRGEEWILQAGKTKTSLQRINVKESGTTLRFLLPLLSLYGSSATVVGEGTLRGRPNRHLLDTLRQQGLKIKGQGSQESVPIKFSGGQLHGGSIQIEGTLSSQFISALLIACSKLTQDTTLKITGQRLVSLDYITMTIQVLKQSGIRIHKINNRTYKIKGGQSFRGLKSFAVPSDYGLAAFLLAAGCLVQSNLVLKGFLRDDLLQADGRIIGFLKKMGARFSKTKNALKIQGPFQLKGGKFSLKDCPDLVPVMAVLALFAKGKTRLCDIKHARVKESDRISDLRHELLKTGAQVEESENELIITPFSQTDSLKKDVLFDPHRDHRLAMAFSLLGLKIGVAVKDIDCVSKSYPGFVRDFKALGAKAIIG